jgi:hypothetical protein
MFIAVHASRSVNRGDVLSEVRPVSRRRRAHRSRAPTNAVGRICGIRAALLEKGLALHIDSLQNRVRDRLEFIADPCPGQRCLGSQ